LLAFDQALDELDAEGGPAGRAARYRANHDMLVEGMTALGFEAYLPAALQSPIITTFRYPREPWFDFEAFYTALSERGFVIYPGKLTAEPCFRIGSIGHLAPADIRALLDAVAAVVETLRIVAPLHAEPQPQRVPVMRS
jgi:2-aminoethylphosphonate-pyruvate transaminase